MSRMGQSGRSSPWQPVIRCVSVRCISCMASMRAPRSCACCCAILRTLALERRLLEARFEPPLDIELDPADLTEGLAKRFWIDALTFKPWPRS